MKMHAMNDICPQNPKRLIFYSHDTFGLGNIRRTLSICQFLMESIPDLSILIISGSPMVHSFRIPEGIDYIKLPCLTRTNNNGYSSKFLDENPQNLSKLRADLILCATANFKPDVIMVDKKPYGVQNELAPTLRYIKEHLPTTKLTLILRDILDAPNVTQKIWEKNGFYEAIETYYDDVAILGTPEVFDARKEYAFSPTMWQKTRYVGYLRREAGLTDRTNIRAELGLTKEEPFVLVTAGGGEDGARVFEEYLRGFNRLPPAERPKTLLIFGPEMQREEQDRLKHWASRYSKIQTMSFTSDLMSYMNAADLVVSMGGYGTICEILSLNKPAIVIPRVHPVEEQGLRASRMAKLGLLYAIHPDDLTPENLMATLQDALLHGRRKLQPSISINL
ncbi:MAG: glycosyltransferase, partial [Nitrospirota bacterium]|nr:glycosyltransferase [Nitrospirota bacterium]